MGLHENECVVTEDALDAVIEKYADTTGIRDLEQAAEHMAANAPLPDRSGQCGCGGV